MRQDFREPVGQVVNGNFIHTEHHHGDCPRITPSELHAARVCPQCRQTTWRLTQHCMHCNIDLFDWDRAKAYRDELVVRREERKQMRKHAGVLFVAGIVLLCIGTMIEAPMKFALMFAGLALALRGIRSLDMRQ